MSQRDSGYERLERDAYETPEWVTLALGPHICKRKLHVWEPAAGSGKMVDALVKMGFDVTVSDIQTGTDFLTRHQMPSDACNAIITNPPYALAREFIDHAMELTFQSNGVVAMLLRTDFDHANSRHNLFGDNIFFTKKVVLTRRIRWIEDSTGSPSFNHAWFIWDWKHQGPPTLAYGP